jgi:hypothetical protein
MTGANGSAGGGGPQYGGGPAGGGPAGGGPAGGGPAGDGPDSGAGGEGSGDGAAVGSLGLVGCCGPAARSSGCSGGLLDVVIRLLRSGSDATDGAGVGPREQLWVE